MLSTIFAIFGLADADAIVQRNDLEEDIVQRIYKNISLVIHAMQMTQQLWRRQG